MGGQNDMQNILSAFLNAGLLPIGEDDEKLKSLEAAAGDLAQQITADPLLAYRFAIVGLSDNAVMADPALNKAEEALVSKWQTAANKIGTNPVQVCRALLLRALEVAAQKNPAIGHAASLIARNESTSDSATKERSAIDEMLILFETKTAEELTEAWVTPATLVLPKSPTRSRKGVSKDQLKAALARAVGPNDSAGTPLNAANPHWPNAGEQWSHEFATRAADAIHSVIQNSSKEFAEEMEAATHQSIRSLVTGLERLAIRDAKTELLWIRTSMYSPSARMSYHELRGADLLLHAVIDVTRAIAPTAPPSVEFFLRDLVFAVSQTQLGLEDMLTEIGPKLKVLPEAETILADPLPATGRRSWLDVATRSDTTTSFENQTGVPKSHAESESELAVKFYRELQIRKLLSAAV